MNPFSTTHQMPCWAWGLSSILILAASIGSTKAQTLYGLQGHVGPQLVTFEAAKPFTYATRIPITNIGAGQKLVGLDSRPKSGAVYVLGYNATTSQAQLYTLNVASGALAPVGSSLPVVLDQKPSIYTNRIGFDFNPVTDQIRVTGPDGQNLRINPDNGILVATDNTLAYEATDSNAGQAPRVQAVAHTNSYAGATTTTLHALNEANQFAALNSPDNGRLTTIGLLGKVLPWDVDLDVYSDPVTQSNQAYMLASFLDPADYNSELYKVDLQTGQTTVVGAIGGPGAIPLTNITFAIRPGSVTATHSATAFATGFSLFPNPVSSHATISFGLPNAGSTDLVLTDALGRTVERRSLGNRAAGAHTLSWEPANHRAGIYLLRLLVDGQLAGVQRIVVSK